MRDGTLLTLALSEMRPNEYMVIGYLMDICDFIFFTTEKTEDDEKYLLDIGAVSKIIYKFDNKINNKIIITGDIILDHYLSKDEFYSFLEEKKVSLAFFKRVKSNTFSVIKVKEIEEILVSRIDNRVKTHAVIIANGIKERIMIKDYRWISYWKHILSMNDDKKLEERINHYKNFFNSNNSYVLLFRLKNNIIDFGRFANDRDQYWICSIFYI